MSNLRQKKGNNKILLGQIGFFNVFLRKKYFKELGWVSISFVGDKESGITA